MIVVDASLAAKWIFREDNSDRARHLYQFCLQEQLPIVAPPLILSEVSNVVRQRMRRTPALPRNDVWELFAAFFSFRIDVMEPPDLYVRAVMIADDHGLPAVYDAIYLALADQLGYEFWTADRRLIRIVAGKLDYVRWVGDFTGSAMPER
ncbi:MAG: type II toxin-antitoxin system VapC family toxin [Chloroflexia bacterium]|nr:type II toxin-antitoxin system VapC family toxin [Chloroflexia bacterium]